MISSVNTADTLLTEPLGITLAQVIFTIQPPRGSSLSSYHVDQAWTEEIERRVREIEEGKVELIPGEEVMKKLRSRSQEWQ